MLAQVLQIRELEQQLVEQTRLNVDNKSELHSTKRKARESKEEADVAPKRVYTRVVRTELSPNIIEALNRYILRDSPYKSSA